VERHRHATFINLSSGDSVIKSESLTAPTGYSITSGVTVAPFAAVVTYARSAARQNGFPREI